MEELIDLLSEVVGLTGQFPDASCNPSRGRSGLPRRVDDRCHVPVGNAAAVGDLLDVPGDLLRGIALLIDRRGDRASDFADLANRSADPRNRRRRLLRGLLHCRNLRRNFICRLRRLAGEALHLARDNREAFARLTRPCSLDCRVERQKIGLLSTRRARSKQMSSTVP